MKNNKLRDKDATGHAIKDALEGKYGFEVVERDDGYVIGGSNTQYFDEYEKWQSYEKESIKFAKGKILDIGCGAGKHSLYLQSKGDNVFGVDISPLTIEVCKKRGLKNAEVLSIEKIESLKRNFDTFLLLGNNFGLLQNFNKAKKILKKLNKLSENRAIIIAESSDPYKTEENANLEYQKNNIEKGKMAGQRRIRIRYRGFTTDWFDYLGVSKEEMEKIVEGTGWKIKKFFDSERSSYIALIEKL